MEKDVQNRRRLIAGLGAAATAVAMGTSASAQTPTAFAPARHELDAWMGKMPGKHRVVLDVTSPDGLPDAVRFTGNLFIGHQNGYNVPESDVAIIVVLRHGATAYGYGAGVWSKHGALLDPKAATPPTGNPYDSGDRVQLSALAKRGVQFMVCGTASRGIARRLVGETGDAEAMFREMEKHLIPNARVVPAGVVGVAHAQEYGFSLLYVG